jgi:hypothetical protein
LIVAGFLADVPERVPGLGCRAIPNVSTHPGVMIRSAGKKRGITAETILGSDFSEADRQSEVRGAAWRALRNEPNGRWRFKLQISNPKSERGEEDGNCGYSSCELRNEPNGRFRFKLQISNPKSERGRGGRELRLCRLRFAKRTQRALALQAPNLKS